MLADKLQLHISPDFLSVDDDDSLYYDGHLSPFFEKDVQQVYGANIVYFDRRPYFHLPNDCNPATSGFIWNTRISLRKPFSVVVDYNVIRNILTLIKGKPDGGYDERYHRSVQLHDDNFIDARVWLKWDDVLVFDIVDNIRSRCLDYASLMFGYLVEGHELVYSIVSLKYAEFNVDYYVGSGNSLPLILAFSRFIYSERGLQWRSEIESISMVQQSSGGAFDRKITNQDGHDGHTFKFNITKGLSLKVYQKSFDHIRVEFGFEKSFIQSRFKVVAFDVVYPALYEFSQSLFKEINFEGILYMLSKEVSDDKTVKEEKIIDFLRHYDSELLYIANTVICEQAVSDSKTVHRIKSDVKLRRLFESTVDSYGNRAYSYNPHKSVRSKRYKRLKPPSKTKLKPLQCVSCKSFYHSDAIRCPYCSEKNPNMTLFDSDGFTDFMKKVNEYKERGYSGF